MALQRLGQEEKRRKTPWLCSSFCRRMRALCQTGQDLMVSGCSLGGLPHTVQRELEVDWLQASQVARMCDPSEVDEGNLAGPLPHQDGNPALDEVLADDDRPWGRKGHVEAHIDA
eukprot:5500410-Heterocapsa_arctica.AAC.1